MSDEQASAGATESDATQEGVRVITTEINLEGDVNISGTIVTTIEDDNGAEYWGDAHGSGDGSTVEASVPDPQFPLQAVATWTGVRPNFDDASDSYPVYVDWGDGTDPQEAASDTNGNGEAKHDYAFPGTYTVTVTLADESVTAQALLTVSGKGANTPPSAKARPGEDNPRIAALDVADFPAGAAATVNWGDNSEPEELAVGQDGTGYAEHDYSDSEPGEYQIEVAAEDTAKGALLKAATRFTVAAS